jgi:TolB-like protein/Tfp pilus assembly protein PilF
MNPILARLQNRKLVQWALAYVAAVFALLQGVDIVAAKFGWPDTVERILIIAGCVGFFVTLLLAWYHGERGAQKISTTELLLLALLLGVGGGLLWKFAVDGPVPVNVAASASSAVPAKAGVTNPAARSSKSVAVLPFENRSASGEDAAFLADGIHEDLINALSRVPSLTVIARTAVLRFRGSNTPMAEIAAALGATHLVEGGVQRAGDRVRINVQLLSASDGKTEWSQRYDRSLSANNIFDLQEEITQALAATLQLQLDTKAGGKLLTGTTGNLAAYETFLKGRNAYEDAHMPDAVRLLQEATRIDPNYALAHGALAEAYVGMANSGLMVPKEAFELAQASARRALELDDHVVQAYTALAEYAFHYEWNWAEAEKSMLRALAIDPNYAIAYRRHSGHLTAWGRFDEAEAAGLRATELSPPRKDRSDLDLMLVGTSKIARRRFQDLVDRTDAQEKSDNPRVLLLRGTALFAVGRQSEGLERLERAAKLDPDSLGNQAALGWAVAQAGQGAKAREIVQRLQEATTHRYVSPMLVAQVAAGLNDRDLAFAQLQKAFDLREPTLPDIGFDFSYDPIRADPRFQELMKKLKLDVFFPLAAK